jgi:methane monooxygenase component C
MPIQPEHNVRLTFEGEDPIDISCREDEDVVSAALRQGVLLVSDCRRGICGSCRGFLEDGQYDQLLDHTRHALSEQDEDDGWVLACRLRPRSALHLDFDYPADRVGRLDTQRRSGWIVTRQRLTESVLRLVVRTLSVHEPLRWEAGQYVRLQLSQSGVTRAFSIANVATGGHDLEFFVRLLPGGVFSGAIGNIAGEGAMVVVEGPLGSFTLDAGREELVFVAGGTGLAPILAMLRKLALVTPHRPATLIFGVDVEERLFGQEELSRICAACSAFNICLAVTEPTRAWSGFRGTVVDALAHRLENTANAKSCHYYICGPAPMVRTARAVALRHGVPPQAIYQEAFVATGVDA